MQYSYQDFKEQQMLALLSFLLISQTLGSCSRDDTYNSDTNFKVRISPHHQAIHSILIISTGDSVRSHKIRTQGYKIAPSISDANSKSNLSPGLLTEQL